MRRLTHAHLLGTEVQDKNGRVKKKVADLDGAKWVSRGRYNYMRENKVELDPNQRIFHADGDVANDNPSNLVCVRFSGKRYEIRTSRVVWRPAPSKNLKPYKIEKRELAIA